MNSTKKIDLCFKPGAIPTVINAGKFYLNDRNFNPIYNLPYTSLHQYFYHATIRIGGEIFQISPGDLTITPERVNSSYNMPESGMHFCAHFVLPKGEEDVLRLPLYISRQEFDTDIGHLFEELISYYRIENQIAQRASGEALRLLLLHLALHAQTGHIHTSRLNGKLESICRRIEAAPEREYTTANLSRQVKLSPNYLAKSFREKYGITISRYQLSSQIERAEFLLKYSNLTIKEIGVAVGLPDPQYFNKRFRAIKGKSPTAFRDQA